MSNVLISGSETCFHLCTIPNLSTRKSKPENCSRLLFNTHLVKPSISVRTQSGSCRARTTRAAINNLCETAQARESFYELLGVSESVTLPEIKKAYKVLALKYHPDVSPPERTEEYTRRFICVQEAYETLSNPKTRALYDRDLAKGFNLASSRRGFQRDQKFEERSEWRDRWMCQLMELNLRCGNNEDSSIRGRGRMSWGARMRSQRSQRFGLGFD